MNGNARLLKYLVVATVATFGMLVLLAGCQKDKPTAGTQAAQTKARETTPAPMKHEPAAMPMKQEAAPAPATQVAQTSEQKLCPVMDAPIDKNIFIEFRGKKVYFCCESCLNTFKANPEKYISKLPQFAK